MSAISLPIITKRSVHFKRYSWNKTSDGTFPPIPRDDNGNPKVGETTEKDTAIKKHTVYKKQTAMSGGKKRKGTYLGRSWDDEAGALPTSATPDSMNFDSLLSQVQFSQNLKPPNSSLSSSKRKRKHHSDKPEHKPKDV